jgi:hypothetical protein
MIFPDWIVVWLAVAGGCAIILGIHRAGIALTLPALVRFGILPHFAAALDQTSVSPFLILTPVIFVFGGVLLLQSVIRPIYGETAGGYVAGNYLVRILDFAGRAIVAVLSLPFRLLFRGRRR